VYEEVRPTDPVELNLTDPHFMGNAYETYAELRAKGPVSRVCFVTHYDEAITTLLDDRFSVDPHSRMSPEELEQQPGTPEEFRLLSRSILALDPPDHTRLRKLVQPSFTGRGMEALRGSIQQIADDLLDQAERDAAGRGETAPDRWMDLIEAFAYPFPVTVISDMLGIPREDRETIRGWTENLLSAERIGCGREVEEEVRAGLREFIDYLKDLFGILMQSRRGPPWVLQRR
jgi:cytochrome P450 PksS